MVNRVEEENSEEGLGIGNFVDVAYGMHEELVGDLSGGDGSQAEDVEPPIVLEPDLEFDKDCVAVGPNHAKWNTQVGIYVRSRIPIHYKDWRKIDGSFKDNVWNKLMEQVEASHKRRKEASVGGEDSVMEVDFDNDELSEVFGPDKGSRTRGISSNKSKKQLQCIGIAKALL
ncbi:hypothetical protein IFM89_030634 [Coptis chinensis]|uniref:Transposase n=1 Tax=Coptis chinensis TaxID=261450 RepID=A0A835HN84_9MAGN|nr:hypothetical protein IFM89_030634 [Coptis chinensis]